MAQTFLYFVLLWTFGAAVPQEFHFPDVSQFVNVVNRAPFGGINKPVTNAPTLRPPSGASDQCYCVPYHTCADNKRTTDLSSNNRTEIQYNGGVCEHFLDVCCGGDSTQPQQPVTQPSGGGSVTQPAGVVTQPTQPVTQPTVTQPPTSPPRPQPAASCGVRNVNGIDFELQGGDPKFSGFAEWPWVVAILNPQTRGSVCGGSLIDKNIVLTGAHCVQPGQESTLIVRAGEWDTETTKERLPFQERTIAQIIQHPEFNDRSLHNNVAIVVLQSPFTLDTHINTVCLPPLNYVADNKNCFAAGWGKTEFGQAGRYSNILKKVQLPMVPHNVCEAQLRKTRLGHKFKLHSSFVCAGGVLGQDTCEGDGGAPLVCPIDQNANSYVQVGIVAWGIGCNTEVPAVYGNVAYLRPWIDETLGQLGIRI